MGPALNELMESIVGYGTFVDDWCLEKPSSINVEGYLFNPHDFNSKGYNQYLYDHGINVCGSFDIDSCVHCISLLQDHLSAICLFLPEAPHPTIPDDGFPQMLFLDDSRHGYFNVKLGHPVSLSTYTLFIKLYTEYKTKCEAEQVGLEYTLVELANLLGCCSIDDVLSDIIPNIPTQVRMMAEYLHLFHDAEYVFTLRPITLKYV